MKMYSKKIKLVTAAILSSFLLAGCSSDDDDDKSVSTSSLRALHLSPDAPAVDISVNDSVALEDVSHRQAALRPVCLVYHYRKRAQGGVEVSLFREAK